MSGPCTDCGGPDYQTLEARIAELDAHAEHDEDNLEGLQHALVRANQQYQQAEAALVDKQKEVVAALQTAVDMEAALAERDRMLDETFLLLCTAKAMDPTSLGARQLWADLRALAEEGDRP